MYFSLRNNRSVEIPSIFTLIKTKYLASYHKTKYYTISYTVYYNKYQKFLGENKIKYRMTASRKAGCSGILKWSVYQSDQKARDRVNHLLSESCPPLRHTLVLTQQAKNLKTKIFNSKKSHKRKFLAEQPDFKNILILPYFNKVYF